MVCNKPLKKAVHFWCAAFFMCIVLFLTSSCAKNREFPSTSWYFTGLKAKESGDMQLAVQRFTAGKTKGDPILAPLCQAELLQIVTGEALKKEQKYAAKHFADDPVIQELLKPSEPETTAVAGNPRLERAVAYAANKDWNRAYDYLAAALPAFGSERYRETLLEFSDGDLSQIFRILLYGYGDKVSRAETLAEMAQLQERDEGYDKICLFLMQFYTGRLYAYAGRQYYNAACNWFIKAMKTAPTGDRYDNALWYLLDTRRKTSTSAGIAALTEYGSTWHDATYFDDFLEDLCADLCNRGQWSTIYQILLAAVDYMSPSVQVQYRYICGRAIETGLIPSVPLADRQKTADSLLNSAWNLHSGSLYYRMILSERLGKELFPAGEGSKAAAGRTAASPENKSRNVQDLLLEGYIYYGFYDRILPLCMEYSGQFELASLAYSLGGLSDFAWRDPGFSSVALRAASFATDWGESNVAFESQLLPYVYPQYHKEAILAAAREFDLDPSLLFGLIRSESYFDAAVVSHAGAIGLSQLMTPTAGDVARKLKVSDYDLTDPETNARFGAFYLAELVRRLDGDVLLAAMSYNAGITNVRNWRRAMADLPHDLFLEAVPYEETRGYGRKITTAYGMYAMLYDSASTHEIVQKLLR
ncbi:MAG: lytic transglycosylase domain-containing protein [Treponemataceae bacterium]|nr:lytic transglycosylase domain-containing protein [Treponemataceae bacterium]